jgi:hypothetical protein
MTHEITNAEKTAQITPIANPFNGDCIESIRIHMTKPWFSDENGPKFKFYSVIEFQNGNTKGEHKIDGDTMDDVYLKTKNFVQSLMS